MDEGSAVTVLVIEDHDSVRIAMTRFLQAGGFNALEAATPDAATALWAEHCNQIALLLVDVDLNSRSGPDLVQEFFKMGPVIPVIFVTAAEAVQTRTATKNFPNPTILQKPFTPEVLVKAVRDALESPLALSGFTTFFKRRIAPNQTVSKS
jgi:two-component system, cell cycle sensor histidine kinase and response regulator CckA